MKILLIGIMGCTSISNSNRIKLKYVHNIPIYLYYNLLNFKDNKDSLVYVISQSDTIEIMKTSSMDSLVEGNFYELELVTVDKGLYMISIMSGGFPFSFRDHNNRNITINDTLVGTVYQSPNIIGMYYIKR